MMSSPVVINGRTILISMNVVDLNWKTLGLADSCQGFPDWSVWIQVGRFQVTPIGPEILVWQFWKLFLAINIFVFYSFLINFELIHHFRIFLVEGCYIKSNRERNYSPETTRNRSRAGLKKDYVDKERLARLETTLIEIISNMECEPIKLNAIIFTLQGIWYAAYLPKCFSVGELQINALQGFTINSLYLS